MGRREQRSRHSLSGLRVLILKPKNASGFRPLSTPSYGRKASYATWSHNVTDACGVYAVLLNSTWVQQIQCLPIATWLRKKPHRAIKAAHNSACFILLRCNPQLLHRGVTICISQCFQSGGQF
eukprot:2742495-Amphidinium_carterae.1